MQDWSREIQSSGLHHDYSDEFWFFHLQHQPVGDEEDDMAMEEMETNQYREVTIKALFLIKKIVNNPCQEMEAGPSSEDSRYWKALEQLDSDSKTGE